MDIRFKYGLELDKLRPFRECCRLPAERKFLLIKEYFDVYLVEAKKNTTGKCFINKATHHFCRDKGVPRRTFLNWLRNYKESGIEGLVPHYNNRFETPKFSARKKHSVKIPHKPPFSQYVPATIEINVRNPLSCLEQINAIVQISPAFEPSVKDSFALFIDQNPRIWKKPLSLSLPRSLTEEETQRLNSYYRGTHKNHSAKALALLMAKENKSLQETMFKTQRSRRTIYKWLNLFSKKGLDFIEVKVTDERRLKMRQERKTRVIDILHAKPSIYGMNRTSWSQGAIREAYQNKYGENLSVFLLKKILKEERYTWQHAKKVLTSPDPEYYEKVGKLLDTLHNLQPEEAFFFIDEAGPWKVKRYGGKELVVKSTKIIESEIQGSKGSVSFIAALDAMVFQAHWQYISNKNTSMLISFLTLLRQKHAAYKKIIWTWDSLSSHSSENLLLWIEKMNLEAERSGKFPIMEIVPLPSCAQFLNVIEGYFSALRRAVIHNSDYQSKDEMKEAISRYFREQNDHYRKHPKKAGKKIWNKEVFKIDELPGGLFKKM